MGFKSHVLYHLGQPGTQQIFFFICGSTGVALLQAVGWVLVSSTCLSFRDMLLSWETPEVKSNPHTFPMIKNKSRRAGIFISSSPGRHCRVTQQKIQKSVTGREWRNLPQKHFNLVMSVCYWINCSLWLLGSWTDSWGLGFFPTCPSLSLLIFLPINKWLNISLFLTKWDPKKHKS